MTGSNPRKVLSGRLPNLLDKPLDNGHVSTLKHNIFSNLAGGAWVAALTLIITPLQINLLGVSAIGAIVKWGIEGTAVA